MLFFLESTNPNFIPFSIWWRLFLGKPREMAKGKHSRFHGKRSTITLVLALLLMLTIVLLLLLALGIFSLPVGDEEAAIGDLSSFKRMMGDGYALKIRLFSSF